MHPETRIGMGRPCLAGTQTAHHQANQHTTVTELPNISTSADLTHDSSGFGSLLVDQSNNGNFTVYQKSAERTRISWPRQNLIHLESDTSDLGLGQSVLGEQHQVEPRIERTEYPIQSATSVNSPGFVADTTSTCLRSKLDLNTGSEARDESHPRAMILTPV
ncbi:cytoplasmic polyadenylation element binding protein [Clonorchis sinensis]|uniref:Cytoplasmic polyadenylation element binding protein n=1 Tax=Clonorchis sinensis TaxID=79923 RepID=G7YMD8_CLOSI|nr:cytoplasmic polyadenylation element binding protein [Clonorchis sinensis]